MVFIHQNGALSLWLLQVSVTVGVSACGQLPAVNPNGQQLAEISQTVAPSPSIEPSANPEDSVTESNIGTGSGSASGLAGSATGSPTGIGNTPPPTVLATPDAGTGFELSFQNPAVLKDLMIDLTYNDSSYVKHFRLLANGSILFVAMDNEHGEEIWITDGTEAGTTILTDKLNPESSTYPTNLTLNADASKMYFACTDHRKGLGICETNGTPIGTKHLGGSFQSVNQIIPCGTKIFVRGSMGVYGTEIMVSDGTNGFTLVKDMTAGSTSLFRQRQLCYLSDTYCKPI